MTDGTAQAGNTLFRGAPIHGAVVRVDRDDVRESLALAGLNGPSAGANSS